MKLNITNFSLSFICINRLALVLYEPFVMMMMTMMVMGYQGMSFLCESFLISRKFVDASLERNYL